MTLPSFALLLYCYVPRRKVPRRSAMEIVAVVFPSGLLIGGLLNQR